MTLKNKTHYKKHGKKKTLGTMVRKLAREDHLRDLRLDVVSSTSVDTAASVLIPISYMAQGTDIQQRQGDKILAKSLTSRFRFYGSPNNLLTTTIRMILFMDTQNAGIVPSVNNVFPSVGTTSMMEDPTWINRQRYKIMYDKYIRLEATAIGTECNKTVVVRKKINKPIYYLGTAATAGSQGRNGLYWLIMSSSYTAGNPPAYDSNHYLTYSP